MIREHAQAVLDLLNADNTPTALVVYDGVVPTSTTGEVGLIPYVVVRFSEGPPELNFKRLTHVYALRVICHCVGGSDSAVRTVVDRVRTALQDVTPVVAGRKCYPIRWEDSAEHSANERTGTPVASMIIGYILRSVPSS